VTQFDELGDLGAQQLFTGFLARTVHGERITMAVVEIAAGAELPEHRHEHEQLGLVIRGSLTFRIGEEERELGAGGIWRIPSNVPHSATGGPDGAVVLDVFNPTRDDWKALEAAPARQPLWP
jgi:quercetin dioxygenase-like cupin family protein